jgi:hypothetical protein
MASEPSGEFITPAVVLRPTPMSQAEFSRRGGQAKSEAKLEAARRNLAKANAIRIALGARPWHGGKKSTD